MRRALFLVAALSACGGSVAAEGADAAVDVTTVQETAALDSFVPVDTSTPPGTRDATPDTVDVTVCDAAITTQCTNGIDDDGDGLVDWLDPECTGPLDRDESSFALGVPSEYEPCKLDCFFDGNIGSGDDGCSFEGKCLPGSSEPRCPFNAAAYADPMQCPPSSEKCQSYCKRLVPNGCDCAGCCDVQTATGTVARVRINGTCTLEKLDDPAYCPRCEKRLDCNKPCNRCDYCIGKTTLPSDCTDAMKSACPAGSAACDPARPCPCGEFCLTGCCVRGS